MIEEQITGLEKLFSNTNIRKQYQVSIFGNIVQPRMNKRGQVLKNFIIKKKLFIPSSRTEPLLLTKFLGRRK